jgi:predicted alpha/beta-hydrolase family hydrolase
MFRLAKAVLAALGVLVLAATTGCSEEPAGPPPAPNSSVSGSASPGPTLPPVGNGCRDLAVEGRTLRLVNAAGHSIAAVDLGSGPMGVVLAHQSDASMCQWLPYATVLASKGYRVVAFDFAGYGASSMPKQKTYLEDIRTVVSYLRDRGTSRVVVMGASMGATMSIVAAAAITPPVQGVIALSPPLQFDGVNAERAAPSLRTPALYVAGDEDGDYEVYARQINQATPVALRNLMVESVGHHGIQFVAADTPEAAKVRSAIEAFLAQHLRPTPSGSPTPR